MEIDESVRALKKPPRILYTVCHPNEISSVFKPLHPSYDSLFSVCPSLTHKMKRLPSFKQVRGLQAHSATADVHCLGIDVNIFTGQSKPDLSAGVMPDCATLDREPLRQIHAAFTIVDPGFKYAEIEWIFK